MAHKCRRGLFTLAVLLLTLSMSFAQEKPGRLIVLGFDGLDHARCQEMIDAGKLPNLQALAKEGTFTPLATTNPAISPVSWSALTTGLNPGATGIDGFLRRDFSDGEVRIRPSLVEKRIDNSGLASKNTRRMVLFPIFAVLLVLGFLCYRKSGWGAKFILFIIAVAGVGGVISISENSLPDGRPYAHNLRSGEAWWETLDAAGVPTATMLAPCSFPAPTLANGRILAGLGVPDALGTFGYWTIFRDDIVRENTTETGGFVKPLIYLDESLRDGKFEPIEVEGPVDIIADDGSNSKAHLAVTLGRKNGVVYVTNGIEAIQVPLGSWSEVFPMTFKMSNYVNVRGFSRFKLMEVDERVRLYLDPINLDPTRLPPGVKLSHPDDYAGELVKILDSAYKTVGWACATNALKDGVLDDTSFLQDAKRVWEDQENLALHELGRKDSKVVTCILTVPDRIQHMFARYELKGYPGPKDGFDPRFRNEINNVYKRVDDFVGLVRARHMKDGDELLIVSDHGMAPWRRSVNLNALLVQEGLLKLKSRVGPRKLDISMREGVSLAQIDWANTKAYSIGLGRIYLNRKGREPQGIVDDQQAPGILKIIDNALKNLKDGGKNVVASMDRGADIYSANVVPGGRADIYVGFNRGYRVSWQSCLGGVDEPVVFENDSAWSADHCSVDPGQVPGVIFTTLKLKEGPRRVVDIAPTILDWAGHPRDLGDKRNGHSLLP
ncbi:MAG: putative AlkP superfamily phosphohydrolase/phosphomutase [Planctomycetota bacterium]|jgi:predicted AlkP superfamily phosphohydrolase/phosphomutase